MYMRAAACRNDDELPNRRRRLRCLGTLRRCLFGGDVEGAETRTHTGTDAKRHAHGGETTERQPNTTSRQSI